MLDQVEGTPGVNIEKILLDKEVLEVRKVMLFHFPFVPLTLNEIISVSFFIGSI